MKTKDKIALLGVAASLFMPNMPRKRKVVKQKNVRQKTKVMPKGVKPYIFDNAGNILSVGVLPEADNTEKVCVYAINETNARRKYEKI